VLVTGDSVLDFKRQITALLLKVKLTRQTITSTVSELKRLRVGDICLSLKTLGDNIFEDLRTILESQRRHVLSSMLRRGVNEIGSAEMKVFLDTDLVPYLTAKERRVTTRARVKEAGEDPVMTLQAYERLRQICEGACRCCLKLTEVVNVWLLPLLKSPLHSRVAEKLVSLALRGIVEISSMPQVRVRESNNQRRS